MSEPFCLLMLAMFYGAAMGAVLVGLAWWLS
jgi:hypothetical protein